MKTLFLAWQDPRSRSWFPIGRLSFDGSNYQFAYIKGAYIAQRDCSFTPLASFPKLEDVYEAQSLFPLFSNRLLSSSRPDYDEFTECLNVPQHKDDPIALLGRSGGRRTTDTLEVFPCPEPDDQGRYHIHFFVHGLRYLPDESRSRIDRLQQGDQLLLVHDFQNPHDSSALMLRTNDSFPGDRHLVGYCPRYLLDDAFRILQQCPNYPQVEVERVNAPPAPLQFRLLCNMTACWPEDFRPCSSESYQPIEADIPTGTVE